MIVRGDGCYLEDAERQALPRRARRPLLREHRLRLRRRDRRGGARADARAALLHELVVRAPAGDRARAEVASLAPGDLNRVFFVSGGSEAVESAWKLARQYYPARGEKRPGAAERARHDERRPPQVQGDRARVAYHGTTLGALSINGIPRCAPVRAARPEVSHVRNTNRYHRPPRRRRRSSRVPARRPRADDRAMGPETVRAGEHGAGAERGRAFTPPAGYFGASRACDRYDIPLCADEVITGFGRVGSWFGSERYDIRPDLVTSRKGLSSGVRAIGAVIATDRVMEPFLAARRCTRTGSPSAGTRRRARSR